jgi:hypothetical protein
MAASLPKPASLRNLRICQKNELENLPFDGHGRPESGVRDETGMLVLLGCAAALGQAMAIPLGPGSAGQKLQANGTQTAALPLGGILDVQVGKPMVERLGKSDSLRDLGELVALDK